MDQPGGSLGEAAVAAWEASPVAMLLIDAEARIVALNAAAEAMLHWSSGHAQGRPLAELVTLPLPAGQAAYAAFDLRVVPARTPPQTVDLHVTQLLENRRLITLHPIGNASLGRHPRPSQVAVGAAAMLAHEIKNPLAAIRGAAQLLDAGALTALIRSEVDRIARLVDGLQDFTDDRPASGAPHNVHALIDQALAIVRAGRSEPPPIAEFFDPSLPPVLVAADAVVQALVNLIVNAIEAVGTTDAGIRIETRFRHGVARTAVGGERQSLPVEIAVVDGGPGPPPDLVDQLFEPFVSGKARGRGLGLALVDKFVRDSGGLVQFAREGQPPHTIFRLLLPRAPA